MGKTRTLIPLNYFYDDNLLLQEKEQIFSRIWQFVCFESELMNDGDYVTIEFIGLSIVLRNFAGEIKAFQNVCLHRFSKICIEKKGNGPLKCPYHGWTYNQKGEPYAIPGRKLLQNEDVNQAKLKHFDVAKIGKFIFIRLNPDGLSIDEFINAETRDLLYTVSDAIGEKIDTNVMTIEANWKINVENTLEDYHVRHVHPESLWKVGINDSTIACSDYHSSTTMRFELKLDSSPAISKIYADRPWHIEDYFHQLIFPNLTIASAFGTTISIQQFLPLSNSSTQFISHVFSTNLSKKNHPVVTAFNDNAVAFNRKVFLEDKLICESVQKGVQQMNDARGYFTSLEERVWFFERTYMNFLSGVED